MDTVAASTLKDGPNEVVSVLLPVPLSGTYDYHVPDGMSLEVGQYVRVQLGSRSLSGVVWGPGSGNVPENKIKPVVGLFALPPMTPELRHLIDWVARYYVTSPGAVLRMAMSVPSALDPPKPRKLYIDNGSRPKRLTPQRARVFNALADHSPSPVGDLARLASVGPEVVRGLARAGHLIVAACTRIPGESAPNPDHSQPRLSRFQRVVAEELCSSINEERFAVDLLDGVTGAGKTEVYFEAIAATLRAGRQVLVLLPEIALSAQWLGRFEARFGARPIAWHSELSAASRRDSWRAVSFGEAHLVVGARSALFLPFSKLGLIVVDEEHDASYKQEEGVCYNARDVAVMRGRISETPVVLVSATPSLESHHNANSGRYRRLLLPSRYGQAQLPDIEAVDMRRQPPVRGRWLSPVLDAAIRETVDAGNQVMLFLNRRGYAPLTLCRSCGFRLHCPNCTAWLVEHRLSEKMCCHHCGYVTQLLYNCPECGSEASLVACGPGVERIAEEVGKVVPRARLRTMTSDTIGSVSNAELLISDMLANRIDVLIGTQMITKGHHFPDLTLVGVVDADLGLAGGDLRASERSVQLLSQVAGRAGRAERPGRVLLQSYMIEHPVIRALVGGDRDRFFAAELTAREAAQMPPFTRLAALIVSSHTKQLAADVAADLARTAPRDDNVKVFGPAPAPVAQLRGRFRFRLLVKSPRRHNLQAILLGWLAAVSWPRAATVRVDMDPYSFM
ncbi:MAG TPA: primosomal protein N' [Acidobacteria bacterium]|nr:primosomal protein N' [Acidobacteriota bacterium]